MKKTWAASSPTDALDPFHRLTPLRGPLWGKPRVAADQGHHKGLLAGLPALVHLTDEVNLCPDSESEIPLSGDAG